MPDSRQDRRRQQRDPNYHFENGRRIAKAGDWASAADAFAAAIKLAPREARFHRALGAVLLRLNRSSEAVTTYERAVNLRPEHAETLAGWGMALGHAGRHAEAIAPLDRALALDPSLASARYSLGLSLARAGDFDRALTFLTGSDAETLLARGAVLMSMGRIDEAERDFHAADAARPNQIITESNLAMLGQYRRDASAPMLLDWHRRFGRSYGGVTPATPRTYSTDSERDRQLTIGFVSGDFRRHAVGVLTIRVIEGLTRRGVRLVCFANQSDRAGDDISARFRAAAMWQSIYQCDDDAAASLIAAQEIDVLVDLSGHTAANRLRLFQRRPAPVQLTWAGYVGTTGLTVFDGLIADAIEVPDGEEQQYSEPIIRLPLCYASFDPPDFAPPVGPLPALATGIITFGSFNRPAKFNEDVLTLWAKLLRAVPNSRLVLNYGFFASQATRARVLSILAGAGVDADRVELRPGGAPHDMPHAYQTVDIALDTFPYSGGVTTLEALWMGVPVISLRGASFAGRHAATHLHTIGLDDFVAEAPSAYVAKAIALAEAKDELATLRASLRERVARSPLCDGDLIAGHFLDAVTALWRDRVGKAIAEKG